MDQTRGQNCDSSRGGVWGGGGGGGLEPLYSNSISKAWIHPSPPTPTPTPHSRPPTPDPRPALGILKEVLQDCSEKLGRERRALRVALGDCRALGASGLGWEYRARPATPSELLGLLSPCKVRGGGRPAPLPSKVPPLRLVSRSFQSHGPVSTLLSCKSNVPNPAALKSPI